MPMQTEPILLYNDECAVCRRIARWVKSSAQKSSSQPGLIEQPIGDDPAACRALNPKLNIWDAYATIHLLMPDGSMKLGGEAVAEVLRRLPNTRWFAWLFEVSPFGFRPFQALLNLGYTILSDVRPLFGCESCGAPTGWWKPLHWLVQQYQAIFGKKLRAKPHFSPSALKRPLLARPVAG